MIQRYVGPPEPVVSLVDEDVELRRFDVEFHLGHLPGCRQAKDVLVGSVSTTRKASGGWRHSPSDDHPQKTQMDRAGFAQELSTSLAQPFNSLGLKSDESGKVWMNRRAVASLSACRLDESGFIWTNRRRATSRTRRCSSRVNHHTAQTRSPRVFTGDSTPGLPRCSPATATLAAG